MPGATLTVDGAGSAFTLSGSGPFSLGSVASNPGTLTVQNSGVFSTGTGTGFSFVNATGTLAVTSGTLNANGNLTLDGGQLTRGSGGTLNLAARKTLKVQSGGDVIITGGFTQTTASTITITGSGSTFSTTGTLGLNGSSTTNVSSGGSLSTGGTALNIGLTSTGSENTTVTVDGRARVWPRRHWASMAA